MFFWIREIAGWLLVILSLWILSIGLQYVQNRQIVEGGVVAVIGLGVMRAGVLLVRVSTAARIAIRDMNQSGPTS
ncbi:MAG: hypothetical protein Aurels2KO_20100 [Aureliella sp.]